MNYGAEPADQVVRYSLEGMEYSLKITGNVAKHVAVFIAAALKDQKNGTMSRKRTHKIDKF